ncbi:uncharacterized protein LOC135826556 [Sycon ciliatum]|uniref:uncharacterized protein LOC135826556 n=1 Tax=Sycon ciliatum TaxID=27933 RepID=UPI0031F6ECB5
MRPSTTEAIRSVAESPQYCCCPQSDIGSVRSQDLVFMCGAEVTTTVPRSTPSTSGDENFDLLDYTPQAQCPSPEVASDGSGGVNPCTRGEITLVRRPSKLSLGGLSLSASGRSHSFAFSPDLRRRPESSHRQRSQSDVIHMATLAAREMRRTMEATQEMERTLQASIGELDEALSRLKVVTSGKQRACSMRVANASSNSGHRLKMARSARSDSVQDEPDTPLDRPLTTEPRHFFSTSSSLAQHSEDLATPSSSIHTCLLLQSPLWRKDSFLEELSDSMDHNFIHHSREHDSGVAADLDSESVSAFAGLIEDLDSDDDETDSSLPRLVVLTNRDRSQVYSLSLDDFRHWLFSQQESWC